MDLEQKRKRIEGTVKILVLLVVGFAVYPFIFMALKGLLALIVSFLVGSATLFFAPVVAAKFANWRLKALKYEASKNPIETLENQLNERMSALDKFLNDIKLFHAEVQNFYSEIERHESDTGQPSKFRPQYSKMCLLLKNRSDRYRQAKGELEQFEKVVDSKRSEWKVAQAAARMSKAANVGEDFMSKLMADTALDAVQTSMNMAFAELETSILSEELPRVEVAPKVMVAIPEQTGPPSLDLDLAPVRELKPVNK